jgi:hypothetical protein
MAKKDFDTITIPVGVRLYPKHKIMLKEMAKESGVKQGPLIRASIEEKHKRMFKK